MNTKFSFTHKRLDEIPRPDKRTVYYDTTQPGLRLLVTETGNKSFQFQMWSKKLGKPLTRTLGKFGTLSLKDAREQAASLVTEIHSGTDIERTKAEANRARILEPTVQDFSEVFLVKYCYAKQLRSVKEIERIIRKEILPSIGKLKISDVKRGDIINLLDSIDSRGALILCNRTLSVLSKMFNFAIERDVIPFSPVHGVRKRGVEQKRERVLNDEQITLLWNSLKNNTSSALLKFLLLTGQRTGEARQMEWSELADNVWTIPASKTKNKSTHVVPLSTGAMEIVNMTRATAKGRYVFPGKKKVLSAGDACLDQNMAAHHLQRTIKNFNWERTTVHDLRRTMRSKLSELGVLPMVAEKILNHKIPGILPVYDHHDYFKEKMEALQKWSDHLMNIVGADPLL